MKAEVVRQLTGTPATLMSWFQSYTMEKLLVELIKVTCADFIWGAASILPTVYLRSQLEWNVRMDCFKQDELELSTEVETYSPIPMCWYSYTV